MLVFSWASWNGANYYIEVFGKRMEKELDQLKKEVARMSKSPEINGQDGLAFSPMASPAGPTGADAGMSSALDLGPPADATTPRTEAEDLHRRGKSVDQVPLLDGTTDSVKMDGRCRASDVGRTLDGGTAGKTDMEGPELKKSI